MKLSVLLITYNHAPFIAQAVRSALAQQTAFDYEVVIGDDASTDGSADVLRALRAEHPGKVRAHLRRQNLGIQKNFIELYRDCRGEYVAFLDGDDYWTSPHKLQKQVDFLDARRDCALCFHAALAVAEDGSEEVLRAPDPARERFELEELLAQNFIPSCSIVVRNGLIDPFPEWVLGVRCMDWVLTLLSARHGAIGYLPDTMAVYRRHAGGVWSTLPPEARCADALAVYRHLQGELGPKTAPLARALAQGLELWVGNRWLEGQLEKQRAEYERQWGPSGEARTWLEAQLGSHRAEIQHLLRAYEDSRAWSATLQQENDELRQQRAALESERDAFRQQRDARAREVEDLRADQRKLADAHGQVQARAAALEGRNAWLAGELERYRPGSERLYAAYRRLERTLGVPAVRLAARVWSLVAKRP